MIPRSDVIRDEVLTSLFSANVSDFLWMAQCSLSNNVTMWIGWNSTLFADKSPINRNKLLTDKPQIYHSPTSVAVIAKTMKRAQKIAKEN